jgi:hypothetical protein
MYECEAENQFKVSKAFINIDGNRLFFILRQQIFFFFQIQFYSIKQQLYRQTIIEYHHTVGFHYIWQMERRLAL